MNFIFSALTVFAFVLCTLVFIYFLDYGRRLRKEEFIDKAIEKVLDKVSTTVTSGIDMAMDQHKTGPWYLAVYTEDSNYPIWISNNTIRIVQPDPANNKIIVKQFNGEDMVIENVINYELCSASDLCEYDM